MSYTWKQPEQFPPHTHTCVKSHKNNEGLKAAPSAWVKNRTNIPKTLPRNHCSAEPSPKHKWNLGRKRICEHEDKSHPSHHAEVDLRGKRSLGHMFGWFVAPSPHLYPCKGGVSHGTLQSLLRQAGLVGLNSHLQSPPNLFHQIGLSCQTLETLRVRCFRWRLFFRGGGCLIQPHWESSFLGLVHSMFQIFVLPSNRNEWTLATQCFRLWWGTRFTDTSSASCSWHCQKSCVFVSLWPFLSISVFHHPFLLLSCCGSHRQSLAVFCVLSLFGSPACFCLSVCLLVCLFASLSLSLSSFNLSLYIYISLSAFGLCRFFSVLVLHHQCLLFFVHLHLLLFGHCISYFYFLALSVNVLPSEREDNPIL